MRDAFFPRSREEPRYELTEYVREHLRQERQDRMVQRAIVVLGAVVLFARCWS